MSDHSIDLPFEPTPPGELADEEVHYSGGVIVMASVVDVPEVGRMPALVFRFAKPLGGFYTPIVLVEDDEQLAKTRPLIMEAIAMARRAAKTGGAT